ncbi:MAG: hypothetical protein GMKNLPBB_00546 [Myxococcota bacterium]|nr:hypothetical protein [Myxococcota bacterium]
MRRVTAIALSTLREALRDRILLTALLFAVFITLSNLLVINFTLGDWTKMTVDLGLAAINGVGLFIAMFLGSRAITREIANHTVLTLLARPLSRVEYIMGKVLGVFAALIINMLAMGAVLWLTIKWVQSLIVGTPPHAPWIKPFIYLGMEALIIVSLAVLFSVLAGPARAVALTALTYAMGYWKDALLGAVETAVPALFWPLKVLLYAVPDLQSLNQTGELMNRFDPLPSWSGMAADAAYSVTCALAAVAFTALAFRKREL